MRINLEPVAGDGDGDGGEVRYSIHKQLRAPAKKSKPANTIKEFTQSPGRAISTLNARTRMRYCNLPKKSINKRAYGLIHPETCQRRQLQSL